MTQRKTTLVFTIVSLLLMKVNTMEMMSVDALNAGLPISLLSGDMRAVHSDGMYPHEQLRRHSSPSAVALVSSHPTDRSQLFVQMTPAVHSDNHIVPAHIVGAYEKALEPQVITLPSRPLDSLSVGSPVSDPFKDRLDFQRALLETPILEGATHQAHLHGVQGPPRTAQFDPQPDFDSQQLRKLHGYTGTAQVVDPEISGARRKSAMQHAGEGEEGEVLRELDQYGRPYSNLQDSKEQEQPNILEYPKINSNKKSRKQPTPFRQDADDRDDQDLEGHVVRERHTSAEDVYKHRSSQKTSTKRLHKKRPSPTKVHSQEEDGAEGDEERFTGLTLGSGPRSFNIQFGGRHSKESRRVHSKSRRTTRRPVLASNEDADDETGGDADEDAGDESRHESRRSLLRMPFRVFRGVSLGRGDDGGLAFNVNLG